MSFEFIGPLSVALFYAKQRFDFVWVGLAILGLVLLFPFDQTAQPLDPLGIAFVLGAGACWTFISWRDSAHRVFQATIPVCLGMFVGMLILMPFSPCSVVYLQMCLNPQT